MLNLSPVLPSESTDKLLEHTYLQVIPSLAKYSSSLSLGHNNSPSKGYAVDDASVRLELHNAIADNPLCLAGRERTCHAPIYTMTKVSINMGPHRGGPLVLLPTENAGRWQW